MPFEREFQKLPAGPGLYVIVGFANIYLGLIFVLNLDLDQIKHVLNWNELCNLTT